MRERMRGAPAVLAAGTAALAWGAWALRENPMAVVMDVERIGLWLALAAALLAAAVVLRLRGRPGRQRTRAVALAGGAAAVVALGLLAQRRLSLRAEEVRFANGPVRLAGTLYLPRGAGPHPAAVVVHGSGPETRANYAFYARHLARHGVAALVYDKRGTGESTGELYATDYAGYAADARAALRHVAAQPGVDARRVGYVGWSEAEWVAPLAAAEGGAAFVAVVAAAGVSPARQVAAEMAIRLRAHGHGNAAVAQALALNEQVFAYQRTGAGGDALRQALAAARAQPWFADAEDLPEEVYPPAEYAWWRSVMDFDSDAAWSRVRVPVLLLKGDADDRSPAAEMRAAVTAALARGGNRDVTVRIFPGADHALLTWPFGAGTPPPAFADGYLATLTDWVRARSGLAEPGPAGG